MSKTNQSSRTTEEALEAIFTEENIQLMNEPDTPSKSHNNLPPDFSDTLHAILQKRELYDEGEENPHKQVGFLDFTVDEGIKDIIESLWVLGASTDFSCQGRLELCHDQLPSTEFYTQIVFLKMVDAINFYQLLTANFGAGVVFSPEGFQLNALEGAVDDLEDQLTEAECETPSLEMLKEFNARTRGEVLFHPGYLDYVQDLLSTLTTEPELDAKRSELYYAEDAEERYEILNIDERTRRLAARDCGCGETHTE